jgi:hypothetical protein
LISDFIRDYTENVMSADNQQERLVTIGWIVGFTDGEGCFTLSINRNKTTKLGWQVMPEFVLTQGEKSLSSLEKARDYFGCGRIYINHRHDNHKEPLYRYCVRRLNELETIIIPFFEAYPLQTWKLHSFQIWSEAVMLIQRRRIHLTLEGIEQLAHLSSQINLQKTPKFLESSETTRQTPV